MQRMNDDLEMKDKKDIYIIYTNYNSQIDKKKRNMYHNTTNTILYRKKNIKFKFF